MATEHPPAAIAAPSLPLFVVTLTGWIAVATVWMSISMAQSKGFQPRHLDAPLTAIILACMAPWVGASTGFWMLLRRSLTAHALAPIVPSLLWVAARSSDPGATGHGGVFLMIVFGVPFAVAASMAIGVVATIASYGVMRAIRRG